MQLQQPEYMEIMMKISSYFQPTLWIYMKMQAHNIFLNAEDIQLNTTVCYKYFKQNKCMIKYDQPE